MLLLPAAPVLPFIALPAVRCWVTYPRCTSHPPAASTSKELRQSTLEALGYCCEELGNLDEDYLSQQVCSSAGLTDAGLLAC